MLERCLRKSKKIHLITLQKIHFSKIFINWINKENFKKIKCFLEKIIIEKCEPVWNRQFNCEHEKIKKSD